MGYSPWGRKELGTTERLHFTTLGKSMAAHSSILAWEILGQRILVGHSPWGLIESDMNEPLINNKQQVKVMGLVQGPHFSSKP